MDNPKLFTTHAHNILDDFVIDFDPLEAPEYSHKNPRPQTFLLPYQMMNHIQATWSSKAYEKLIKTCKFFFSKHKIIPMDKLNIFFELVPWDPDVNDNGEPAAWYFHPDEYNHMAEWIIENEIDLKTYKIWLSGQFGWYSKEKLTDIFPFIYRWDITDLAIRDQTLTVDEFTLIASKKIVILKILETKIMVSGGGEMFLEEILTLVPNIKEFTL